MDWILEHIWVVIAIGGVIVRMLQAARKKVGGASPEQPPRRQEYIDAELADRTRRIREELMRKRQERLGGRATPAPDPARPIVRAQERSPQATTPPAVSELPSMVRKVLASRRAPEPPPLPDAAGVQAAELARQAALAEQLRAAVARRERSAAAFAASQAATAQPATELGDLQDPAELRRAMVLREILGPPLSLRG